MSQESGAVFLRELISNVTGDVNKIRKDAITMHELISNVVGDVNKFREDAITETLLRELISKSYDARPLQTHVMMDEARHKLETLAEVANRLDIQVDKKATKPRAPLHWWKSQQRGTCRRHTSTV